MAKKVFISFDYDNDSTLKEFLVGQPHRFKLELACKLPPLHDPPPVPLKHLTRCLRNRVQASYWTAERSGFVHLTQLGQFYHQLAANGRI